MKKMVKRGGSSDKQKSQNSKKCHTRRKVEKGYGDARAGAGASVPQLEKLGQGRKNSKFEFRNADPPSPISDLRRLLLSPNSYLLSTNKKGVKRGIRKVDGWGRG